MRTVLGVVIVLVAVLFTGCGHRAAPPVPKAKPTAAAQRPLPEWAPANPSPEFVRGAQVLKPFPPEMMRAMEASLPDKGEQALMERCKNTFIPAYEFFGALSDQQIERFKTTRQVRVPVKSMTRTQQHALDSYFDGWRTAMASDSHFPDLLVMLYKDGAKQDLSNVDAGFVSDGRGVNLQFWITRADGSVSTPSNSVAMM